MQYSSVACDPQPFSRLLTAAGMSSRAKTVCEICGESFLTENKLSNHITERHVHASSTSPSASPFGTSSKRRKLDAASDVRCPLCDYVDLDTDRLQQHVNRMHFDPGSPRRPGTVDFPCPICPLAFEDCDSLETHINEEHHDIVSPQSVTTRALVVVGQGRLDVSAVQ